MNASRQRLSLAMIEKSKIRIIVGCVDSQIVGIYPHKEISDALSYAMQGAYFSKAFKEKRWDGRIRLLQRNKFPTGCLDIVEAILIEQGREYEVEDLRPLQEHEPSAFKLPGVSMRPYQIMMIARMLEAMTGYISVATGGGKTLIAAALIKGICQPSAFLVHNTMLFDQTIEVFERCFGAENVGRFRGGQEDIKPVTVFMVQALRSHIGNKLNCPMLDQFRVMIVDECHHVASNGQKAQWYQVARRFKNAPFRFGMTATPQKKRWKILMHAALGKEIAVKTVSELQSEGYLSETDCIFYRINVPDIFTTKYADAYNRGIVENVVRNEYAVRQAIKQAREKKIVLLMVDKVAHGAILKDHLDHAGSGLNTVFLWGAWTKSKKKRTELAAVKQDIKDRKIDIVIATRGLVGEGVDIPVIDCIVNVAGGKSDITFRQMFGRGLRIAEDKEELTYIDFVDEQNMHLYDHSHSRISECKKMKQKVSIRLMEN